MAVPIHKQCSIRSCESAGVSFLIIEMRRDMPMRLRRCPAHTPSREACNALATTLGAIRVEVLSKPVPTTVPVTASS